MHITLDFLLYVVISVENGYYMESYTFEATGLKDSHTESRAEYHPVPRCPSHGNPMNPMNPVPTNVMSGILAAQDSVGIPVPVPCEQWLLELGPVARDSPATC